MTSVDVVEKNRFLVAFQVHSTAEMNGLVLSVGHKPGSRIFQTS